METSVHRRIKWGNVNDSNNTYTRGQGRSNITYLCHGPPRTKY